MVINGDLLEQRKRVSEHRPKFRRQESWRYKRLAENWRKPKGIDNKMRLTLLHGRMLLLLPKKDHSL